jgi:acyl-CoA synthetase (NDP forming)
MHIDLLSLVLSMQELIPSLHIEGPAHHSRRRVFAAPGEEDLQIMSLRGHDLVALLGRPRSIAVIGASTRLDSPSGRPVDYLLRHGFAGTIIPVNARQREVAGLAAVPSLRDVEPGTVDAVLVAVPAAGVVAALQDAEAVGAQVAVIIGSGFEDRRSAERRALDDFLASSDMRVVGPNCVGTLGVEHSSLLTFSSVLRSERPRPGSVGLVTQSGALGNSLLQTLIRRHVGLSQWFSSGDEADVGALELTTGLLSQDGTTAVGLFLEGIGDLDWLPELERVLRDNSKRLFVLKAAKTSAGRAAAAGHTGRVVGSATASRAILREIGAREVSTLSALADALVIAGTTPPFAGPVRPRTAIVTISGAAGVIGADRVTALGRLGMAPIDEAAQRLLESRLDARLTPANPLDVPFLDDTAAFADAISAFAATGVADVVVGVESGLAHDRQELAAKLVPAARNAAVVLTSLSEDDQIPSDVAGALARAGIAYLPTIDRAIDALATCAGDITPKHVVTHSEPGLRGMEWAAQHMGVEFPWAPWRVVDGQADLDAAIEEFGIPLVLKAAGRTITHRSELGAVRVVRDRTEARESYDHLVALCARHSDVVVAQRFAPSGFEVMVAAMRDEECGPIAFVRPGGTFAETMTGQAVLWGGWPEDRRERILRASLIGQLLDGYRGGPSYDITGLNSLVSSALAMVVDGPQFVEMNPVIVASHGLAVVDVIARD